MRPSKLPSHIEARHPEHSNILREQNAQFLVDSEQKEAVLRTAEKRSDCLPCELAEIEETMAKVMGTFDLEDFVEMNERYPLPED